MRSPEFTEDPSFGIWGAGAVSPWREACRSRYLRGRARLLADPRLRGSRGPARPAPAGSPCPELPAARARPASAVAGGVGGRRGRGKAGAGAVVSASPTRAQVLRRGARVWSTAHGDSRAERGAVTGGPLSLAGARGRVRRRRRRPAERKK